MKLWTCIATCRACGDELNRATNVPENKRTLVALGAPLMAICEKPHHSTLSDCNIGVQLEWIEQEEEPQKEKGAAP